MSEEGQGGQPDPHSPQALVMRQNYRYPEHDSASWDTESAVCDHAEGSLTADLEDTVHTWRAQGSNATTRSPATGHRPPVIPSM
jgi:hypothetical protein